MEIIGKEAPTNPMVHAPTQESLSKLFSFNIYKK